MAPKLIRNIGANRLASSHTYCSKEIWAVTSYFNPCGYRSRRLNYEIFRSRLNLPLLAIEQQSVGGYDLRKGDAEILLQVPAGDVLWQKERLINLGVASLPQSTRFIVWMDCDVVIPDPSWIERLREALDKVPVVHCYSELVDLDKGCLPESADHSLRPAGFSVVRTAHQARASLGRQLTTTRARRRSSPGGAWGARREVFERHGLYDAMVLGGADRAFAYGCFGLFGDMIRLSSFGDAQARHYLNWAQPLFADVQGQVGVLEGQIYHLWHGSMDDRGYETRHETLRRMKFDPARDIAIGAQGLWEWTEAASEELRQIAADHFKNRREDN